MVTLGWDQHASGLWPKTMIDNILGALQGNGTISGGAGSVAGTDMESDYTAGAVRVNRTRRTFAAGSVVHDNGGANPRYDLVVYDYSADAVVIVKGAEVAETASQPRPPTPYLTDLLDTPLYIVYVPAGATNLNPADVFNRRAFVPESPVVRQLFGDGSDGDVTISGGTTTLTRPMFYDNLTIASGGVLDTAGYIVCVRTKLTVQSGGIIRNNGGNASVSAGTSPPGVASGGDADTSTQANANFGRRIAGTEGGTGNNGGTSTASGTLRMGIGGGGGRGSHTSGTEAGPAVTARPHRAFALMFSPWNFGGGRGGYSGSSLSNGNGSGGGGGGVVEIWASEIVVEAGGTIQANGGNGAAGGSAGAQGGGGGGGGAVLLYYGRYDNAGTVEAAGGLGALDFSGGGTANDGDDGQVIATQIVA